MTSRWTKRAPGAVVALALMAATGAHAQDPVAIVEDVTGRQATVQFMDYLTAGTIVTLESADTLVLGYMRSCWRETIKGGVVTVGLEQSVVAGGEVKRQKVECDGGRMRLTTGQAGQAGVMVFRGAPRTGQAALGAPPPPQLTLYGRSPVIEMKGGGRVVIERLDKPGERQEIEIRQAMLTRGAFYDLIKENKPLTAGGIYRAKTTSGEVVFKIDPQAKSGQTPIIGRLLKL